MRYLEISSAEFGKVITKENCDANLPNGTVGCALAERARTPEGALEIARSFMGALSDDNEMVLPIEVQLGKAADGHASGTCIHASRVACATLIEAIDAGIVSHKDAVLAIQWTVAAGYGTRASIAQDPRDHEVISR